jgi:hypothetical protein
MDVVNFPGIIAEHGLLLNSQINPTNDLILIGKKVNDRRDGSQYQEMAIPVVNLIPQVPYNVIQTTGSTIGNAIELAIGLNDVTVIAPDGALKLPVTAPIGSIVKVVSNTNYSIFSITGAIIGTFGNGTALTPSLDLNGVNLCVEYVKHSNGTWRYSCNHNEL